MSDTRVTAILDAARKRFAHYGLSKTTMNEIAADIGMSKAALYYYFPDKDQLFIAVVEQDVAEFIQTMETLIARPSKASFKFKKYIGTRQDLLKRLLNLAKVESVTLTEVFNPLFDDLRQRIYQKELAFVLAILVQGIDNGEFRKVPADSYAELFLSTLVGLRTSAVTSTQLNAPLNSDRSERLTLLFVDVFLKSLKA